MQNSPTSPFGNASSSSLDQDLVYLKWDLQRFSGGKEYALLPDVFLDQVQILVVQLSIQPVDIEGNRTTLTMLRATEREMKRLVADAAADEAKRDGSLTLRKRMVRSELIRTLTRIAHIMPQIENRFFGGGS